MSDQRCDKHNEVYSSLEQCSGCLRDMDSALQGKPVMVGTIGHVSPDHAGKTAALIKAIAVAAKKTGAQAMTMTQEQLEQFIAAHLLKNFATSIAKDYKLVSADAVVLTREERDAMVYAAGCLDARIERAGMSVVVAADVVEAKHHLALLLTAIERTALAPPHHPAGG
jgi:hypothetical protein